MRARVRHARRRCVGGRPPHRQPKRTGGVLQSVHRPSSRWKTQMPCLGKKSMMNCWSLHQRVLLKHLLMTQLTTLETCQPLRVCPQPKKGQRQLWLPTVMAPADPLPRVPGHELRLRPRAVDAATPQESGPVRSSPPVLTTKAPASTQARSAGLPETLFRAPQAPPDSSGRGRHFNLEDHDAPTEDEGAYTPRSGVSSPPLSHATLCLPGAAPESRAGLPEPWGAHKRTLSQRRSSSCC